jgi:hypothetical protein
MQVVQWPLFNWADGYTPGPDQFNNRTYYTHWGGRRWACCVLVAVSVPSATLRSKCCPLQGVAQLLQHGQPARHCSLLPHLHLLLPGMLVFNPLLLLTLD